MRVLYVTYTNWKSVVQAKNLTVYEQVLDSTSRHVWAGSSDIVYRSDVEATDFADYTTTFPSGRVIVPGEEDAMAQIISLAVIVEPVLKVVIDEKNSRTVVGKQEFDRDSGGSFSPPSGDSFPDSPIAKEMFWKTDESKLYRRNNANSTWESVNSPVSTHTATHQSGGSDELAHQSLEGAGTQTHGQLDAHVSSIANPHSVTAAQVGAPTETQHNAHKNSTANPHSVTAAQVGAIAISAKGAANGVASLDSSGKVPTAQLPASTGLSFSVVADATARAAISPVVEGDEAYQQDDDSQWIYDGSVWFERPSNSGGSGLPVDRHFARSDGQDSNSSSWWDRKLRLTANVVGGVYRIEWYAEVSVSSNNKGMEVRIQCDGSDLARASYEPRSSEYPSWTGWDSMTLSAGSHDFDIDFRRVDNTCAYMRNARISLWKVAN